MRMAIVAAFALLVAAPALAQSCKLEGSLVTCDDGRQGVFEGNAILWPDGTRSRPAPHDSVHIGHKQCMWARACSSAKARASCPSTIPMPPTRPAAPC